MRLQPLILIPSQHRTDCGIVALATLTGITYQESLQRLLPFRKKHANYGVFTRDIERQLVHLGYQLRHLPSHAQISTLRQHAILMVRKPTNCYQRGWDHHVAVWDAKSKCVWDPGCKSPTLPGYWQPRLVEGMTVRKS